MPEKTVSLIMTERECDDLIEALQCKYDAVMSVALFNLENTGLRKILVAAKDLADSIKRQMNYGA